MRPEAGRRDVALGEEGEAVIDDVIGEDAAVGVLGGLRRVEAQHVGQNAVGVDRGDGFLASVVARMPHQVDELIEPARAIVHRLAGVVFQLGVVGVEEAANARVAGAIDMKQRAVLAHAASAPDPDLRRGAELARRQLDHHREHIGFRIRIHAGPRRLAAHVRRGEVSPTRGIEQILDAVEVKKERVAATAGEERVGAGLDDGGRGAEGDLGIGDNLLPDHFDRAGFRAFCREDVHGLPAVLRR